MQQLEYLQKKDINVKKNNGIAMNQAGIGGREVKKKPDMMDTDAISLLAALQNDCRN